MNGQIIIIGPSTDIIKFEQNSDVDWSLEIENLLRSREYEQCLYCSAYFKPKEKSIHCEACIERWSS